MKGPKTPTQSGRKLSPGMLAALRHVGYAELRGRVPRWMGVSTQRTLTIAWLLLRGLVERGPDAVDSRLGPGRVARYGLTDEGRRVLLGAAPAPARRGRGAAS